MLQDPSTNMGKWKRNVKTKKHIIKSENYSKYTDTIIE